MATSSRAVKCVVQDFSAGTRLNSDFPSSSKNHTEPLLSSVPPTAAKSDSTQEPRPTSSLKGGETPDLPSHQVSMVTQAE